jgi:hypothetical protein
MPDFDANDDPLRLNGAGNDQPLDPAGIRLPVQRRARQLAYDGCFAGQGRPERRIGATLLAQRRHAARRACPDGWAAAPGAPVRSRRHPCSGCHGRPPRSSS